ncbi:hypothetical protein AACH10_15225 [Ideonella sp. DXS22W]|uniref:Uncharacterized protein n=1 Tax=Pseudaquabacterium inlustre TaxID=2984192 RepID=A0ABU9CM02_9BURK
MDATNDSRTQAQRLAVMPAAPDHAPSPVRGGAPLVADLSQYMLRVDLRYGWAEPFAVIGNGGHARCDGGTAVSQVNNFEQVFIGASPFSPGQVPEPMSLLLAGAATRRRTAR